MIKERSEHHKVVERVRILKDAAGNQVAVTNRWVSLETGASYFRDGQWHDTEAEFELFADGAVAVKGPHQLIVAKNLRGVGSIDLLSSDGQRFLSTPTALSYFDPLVGKTVLLAEVKDSEPVQVAPNTIVFPDCLSGLRADLRLVYTKTGMEQFLVL